MSPIALSTNKLSNGSVCARADAAVVDAQGCNTETVRALLGGEDLNESNMLAHLGIIEQRSNELLQVRCHGVLRTYKDSSQE